MSQPLFLELPLAGLSATLGYRFQDSAGAWIGARITTGITEDASLSGTYSAASPTTPANAWKVYWNDTSGTGLKATQVFDFIGNVNPFSTGWGPKAVTIHTTDDSAVALGAVIVNVIDGNGITVATGLTNGSGDLVVALLASTAYTILCFKSGYQSATSTQTTSAGNGSQTLTTIVLTAIVAPSPSSPEMATVTGTLLNGDGSVAASITGKFTLHCGKNAVRPLISAGNVLTTTVVPFRTNASGVVKADNGTSTLEVNRTDFPNITQANLTDAAAYWIIEMDSILGQGKTKKVFVTTANYDLSTVIAAT